MAEKTRTHTVGGTKVTIDHGEIGKWAEAKGGHPARVKQTGKDGRKSKGAKGRTGGILRIDFAERDETLEPIPWEDFFKVFDDNNLAFVYQEKNDGGASRFFKFVDRDSIDPEDLDENLEKEVAAIDDGVEEDLDPAKGFGKEEEPEKIAIKTEDEEGEDEDIDEEEKEEEDAQ